MILDAMARAMERVDLTEQEAAAAMREIMSGQVTPSQIAGYLVALAMKGEIAAEITGSVRAMREFMRTVRPSSPVVVDTCGTGGDRLGTFNVSSAAAFVVAGAGLVVAKHGNRSVSSKCGSTDILEALGVKVDCSPEVAERCLNEHGIAFFFAPLYHPAMKHAMPTRRELGRRTIFNILGPLCNPAGANVQVVGVYADALTEPLARVLGNLGSRHALVVHGADGMDEATTTGPTRVTEVCGGATATFELSPEQFGIPRATPEQLKGGDAKENAALLRKVLSGEPGPYRDIVVLNAAAAIAAATCSSTVSDGIARIGAARPRAEEAIDSGAALKKLETLVLETNR